MTDRAELMQEAAAQVANTHGIDWTHDAGTSPGKAITTAIRAIPLPPAPPLADDVAGVVARLRGEPTWSGLEKEAREAADLIERLAQELAKSDAASVSFTRGARILHDDLAARAERAEAEVARLREALAGISATKVVTNASTNVKTIWDIVRTAAAALTPKGDDHD